MQTTNQKRTRATEVEGEKEEETEKMSKKVQKSLNIQNTKIM